MSTEFAYLPKYAKDITIYYTVIDYDPLEIEIQSIEVHGAAISEWLQSFLLDQHETDWTCEILDLVKCNIVKARELV